MAKITIVGEDYSAEFENIRSINVGDIWFAPIVIDQLGNHPEQLMSIKKDGDRLLFRIVKVMDENETKAIWGNDHQS